MTISPSSGPLLARLFAALVLQRRFYEAAASDTTATGPAGAMVCVIALARQSPTIYELSQVYPVWGLAIPVEVGLALLSWLVMGIVTTILGRFWLQADYRRILRCLGFAQAPTMTIALAYPLAPPWNATWLIIAAFWALAAIAVAIRAALGISTRRAWALALPVFAVQRALLLVAAYLAYGAFLY